MTRRVCALVPAAVLAAVLAVGCSGGTSSDAAASRPSAFPPASPSPSPTPEPDPAPVPLDWTPCGDGFECAAMPVVLDPADAAAGTLDLAVTRRAAGRPAERLGSLVVNPGGPGVSAVDYLQRAWRTVPEPVRARFDLVAFDPRGVGGSGQVRCATTEQLDAVLALDPDPDDARELQALVDASAGLARGCTARAGGLLPHVSTADAARDLEQLRASLGDPGLTYLGYSYGTSLGAAYLRRWPERVRAMVLDGALDPSLTWEQLLDGQGRGFEQALQSFLADCEATRCAFRRAVDGDLGAAFDRLAARVETAPLPGDGARTVGPGELATGVGAGLYSRSSGWPAVAQALAEAERGSGATLLALADSYLQRDDDGYAGSLEANLAVNCLDRPWPREPEPYTALADRLRATAPRLGPGVALSGLSCARWPVPPATVPSPVRAEGAPPVVVVGTTRDPATPYAWSQALAAQLVSGVLLTRDGDGHTVYRAGGPACLREPVDAYLLTGQAPAPLTC